MLDDPPEFDEGFAGVADLEAVDLDVAAEEFVEDRPAAEEGLVVGRDLTRELGDDLLCLSAFPPVHLIRTCRKLIEEASSVFWGPRLSREQEGMGKCTSIVG